MELEVYLTRAPTSSLPIFEGNPMKVPADLRFTTLTMKLRKALNLHKTDALILWTQDLRLPSGV